MDFGKLRRPVLKHLVAGCNEYVLAQSLSHCPFFGDHRRHNGMRSLQNLLFSKSCCLDTRTQGFPTSKSVFFSPKISISPDWFSEWLTDIISSQFFLLSTPLSRRSCVKTPLKMCMPCSWQEYWLLLGELFSLRTIQSRIESSGKLKVFPDCQSLFGNNVHAAVLL